MSTTSVTSSQPGETSSGPATQQGGLRGSQSPMQGPPMHVLQGDKGQMNKESPLESRCPLMSCSMPCSMVYITLTTKEHRALAHTLTCPGRSIDAGAVSEVIPDAFAAFSRQAEEPLPAEATHSTRNLLRPRAHSSCLPAYSRQDLCNSPYIALRGGTLEKGSVVGRRSQPAMSFAVGVCEEPAPSTLSSAQTEEEPTYEVPPEQDTLYEEPPLVGP